MGEITARTSIESSLPTKHHTDYQFTPLSHEAFIITPFYESGCRFKWINDIPNLTELDEAGALGSPWYDRLDASLSASHLDIT